MPLKSPRRRRRLFKFFLPRKWFVAGILLVLVGLVGILWNEFFLSNSSIQPKTGGIYTESTIGEIRNLNPLSPLSSTFDRDLQQLIFAGLLKYDPKTEKVIKYKLITNDISIEAGELTPSMKICRNKIEVIYKDDIDSMY